MPPFSVEVRNFDILFMKKENFEKEELPISGNKKERSTAQRCFGKNAKSLPVKWALEICSLSFLPERRLIENRGSFTLADLF